MFSNTEYKLIKSALILEKTAAEQLAAAAEPGTEYEKEMVRYSLEISTLYHKLPLVVDGESSGLTVRELDVINSALVHAMRAARSVSPGDRAILRERSRDELTQLAKDLDAVNYKVILYAYEMEGKQ
jgi:hypothetical protein